MVEAGAPTAEDAPYLVVGAERRTTTIRELWLRPLAGVLQYRPGEYVLVEDGDRAIAPRSYSIANAPRPDGLISLLVTRVRDGQTSTWLHERLRVGDDVVVSGPYGTFTDDPVAAAPALFLAAGSGLAPIRSLLEAALSACVRTSLTLIISARSETDVIDCGRFTRWHASHPRFEFQRTLTRADGPGPHGRIPDVLPSLCGGLGDHDTFVAGAPGFVRACAIAVEALGGRPGRIHTEEFFVEPGP
jgi:CDP-4-dehydro-6-deoxyglucose reductase, E3